MKIIDRLPIYGEDTIVTVQGEPIQIWRNQIVVWLSILGPAHPFPAILDTGHSHNLSISQRHFDRWCGAELRPIGTSKVGKTRVPHFEADVYIHRNVPGNHALRGAYPLRMDQGIAVVPDDSPAATRLPLLGLRAFLVNELELTVHGKRRQVSIRRPIW